MLPSWLKESGGTVSNWTQKWMQDVLYAGAVQGDKKTGSQAVHRLLTPEDDIKHLMMTASSIKDLWQFFVKRLNATGAGLDLMCLSVMDESGDFIRIKYLYPLNLEVVDAHYEPIISMSDTSNHLVQAYQRKDTTFTPNLKHLGRELEVLLQADETPFIERDAAETAMHIFSVPFIASDKTIAMMTLGFQEMDAFSQAKLSYVYTMRDQIAQLVWNLVLQDRMKSQSQIDNLTGLASYSYFQQTLEVEINKAQQFQTPLTVMVMDINNIHQINEAHGHVVGDAAICHLASTVRRLIRGLDTVARYGGDDIIVLLPESGLKMAEEIGERIIQGINTNMPKSLRNVGSLYISMGHATFPHDVQQPEDLLKIAEQALHLAKFRGAKTGESARIASNEVEQLNDKMVLEVFASHVAKKYNDLRAPSLYQELLTSYEKKGSLVGGYVDAEKAEKSLESLRNDLMLETITSLASALDAKDRYTRGHSQAVANYAVALAHALKLEHEQVEEIRLAAFLHDIGKIGIPESILLKEGPLTEKELDIMKQHPVIGAEQILAPVTSLRPIIPAVLHHHENWDGTGYPHGLMGEDIPLGARIVSLVDVFHALTSDRAYRKALPVVEAKQILEAGSGTKWDPHLIDVFFQILTIASPNTSASKQSKDVRETVLNSPLVREQRVEPKSETISDTKLDIKEEKPAEKQQANVVLFTPRDRDAIPASGPNMSSCIEVSDDPSACPLV